MSGETPRFFLTPVLGGPGSPRYPIHELPSLIGRSEEADIPLLEPTVSRQHATIQVYRGAVHLEDLGSKHGTYVNSKRITTATISAGDVIVFGLTLVLRLERGPHEAGSPATGVRHHPTINELPALGPLGVAPTAAGIFERSEIDALQQRLAAARKLAANGALCSVRLPQVNDRLRTVLKQLGDRVPLEGVRHDLEAAAQELQAIVDALTISAVELSVVELGQLLERAIHAVISESRAQGVTIHNNVPAQLFVRADPERLIAALIEILRNACGARGDVVEVDATPGEGKVVLNLRDYGGGIPEDLARRAFDPFVTLPADGQSLGLGLLLARQLVMAFGAGLTLESRPDHGTTVRIRLDAR